MTKHTPDDVDPDYYCTCGDSWLDHNPADLPEDVKARQIELEIEQEILWRERD